jgi:hypothetical protein
MKKLAKGELLRIAAAIATAAKQELSDSTIERSLDDIDERERCLTPDQELADVQCRLRDSIAWRDAADAQANAVMDCIVESVRVEEGEDSVFLAVLERAGISTRNLH